MAEKYLNLAGLQRYDQNIKDYIAVADAAVIETVENDIAYDFSEGNVEGSFSVSRGGGEAQAVAIHGLRDFCLGDDDDEIIFDCGTAADMLQGTE